MSYPGGPLQLFRAMMFCRHAAGRTPVRASGADGGTSGEPDDLLALTLGAQATAEWLAWDLAQVPAVAATVAPAPADDSTEDDLAEDDRDGDVAARLAETYAAVARPAVTGTAGPPQRTLRKPAKAAGGARGRRTRELLNLGVAVRPEGTAFDQAADGLPDWRWSSDGNSGPVPGESLDLLQRCSPSGCPRPRHRPRIPGRTGASYGGPAERNRPAADPAKLSQREREVAVLVVTGMGSARVAAELGIAVNTVNAHLQRIYGKLGVSRRQELAELWNSLDGTRQ